MFFCQIKFDRRTWRLFLAALLALLGCVSAHANVYATDIKLNGSTNNAAMVPADGLQISYILNEPATQVTLQVLSSGIPCWTTNLTATNQGTLAGSNSVFWNGTNQSGIAATAGVYQISITAQSAGYPDWTNILDDSTNFLMTNPSGIDVNKNTNSPFYGRVFVCNAPPLASGVPGISKFNADGSAVDEGMFSTGGYPWGAGYGPTAYGYSPWKIVIAGDDKVYINDWSADGEVLAFDELISTNNYLPVLTSDNYPEAMASLSGLWVSGFGTNTQIWMTDQNTNSSAGIIEWTVSSNGTVASGDMGTVVVGINSNGLNFAPYDVSVDTNGNIYTIQSLDGVANPGEASSLRLFCFTNFSGQADSNAIWSVGSQNNMLENADGVSVDPTARYVAVAMRGYDNGNDDRGFALTNGGVNLYNATNGSLLASLGEGTNDPEYFDVAWDNAGNLYATYYAGDDTIGAWRVFSPPGTNQATTVAVPVVQVYSAFTPPSLVDATVSTGLLQFTLQGQSNVTYLIEYSADLVTWTNTVPPDYTIPPSYDTSGTRTITVPGTNNTGFFRAVVLEN